LFDSASAEGLGRKTRRENEVLRLLSRHRRANTLFQKMMEQSHWHNEQVRQTDAAGIQAQRGAKSGIRWWRALQG
jgi:hypothetical protein